MNVCIWSTHHTLTEEHCKYSIWALFGNQTTSFKWNKFIIWNTHPEEISNNFIENEILKYSPTIDEIIKLEVPTSPCTTSDFKLWLLLLKDLGIENTSGVTFFTKSDYAVTSNFNSVLNEHISKRNFMWSLPVCQLKKKVSLDSQIVAERINSTSFIPKDSITLFRSCAGSKKHEPYSLHKGLDNDPRNGRFIEREIYPVDEDDYHLATNPVILFVTWWVPRDYSTHIVSNDVLSTFYNNIEKIQGDKWNNIWHGNVPEILTTVINQGTDILNEFRCTALHMYHDVISKNNPTPRSFGYHSAEIY